MKIWTYSCCEFEHEAPTQAQQTVNLIFEHQRDWHPTDPWQEFKITETDTEN